MKFFTLFFVMAFAAITSYAQVSLGIRGGYVNTGLESSGAAPGTTRQDNWQAGLYANIPLFERGYLHPGMSYLVKGAGLNYALTHPVNLFSTGATKLKLQYLELPVNLVYKVPVSFGKLFAGVGPYAAYCLRGDYDLAVYNNGQLVQSGSQQLAFKTAPNVFGTNIKVQRWDAGLNCCAGVELNCFLTLTGHYGYGLTDIDKSAGNNFRNRYWGLSLGFLFDREDW